MFASGVQVAAMYGAQIWGLSSMEVTSLRKIAASAMTPKGKGKSLTLLQLAHNTPTAAAAIAPVTQYHRMIWKAVTRTAEGAEGKGPRLPMLRKLWEDVESGFRLLVAKALGVDGGGGASGRGKEEQKSMRQVWRQVKGPFAATAVTLARIGLQ